MDSPLAGKRIVVTRRAEQAVSFCTRLRALGADPICFPTIVLEPLPADELDGMLGDIAGYDWLIFTSANAVHFFFARAHAQSSAVELPAIAVVGTATLSALHGNGHDAAAMPAEFTGEALARSLGDLHGKHVLLPRAKQGRPEIVAALAEAGASIDDVPLYDTVLAQPKPEARAAIESGVDALTFTSPSTARNFYCLIEPISVSSAVVACIGPTTADAVRALGIQVHVVPAVYTAAALADALVGYYQKGERSHVFS